MRLERPELDRKIVMKAVVQVENHTLHPMFRTRDALQKNLPDANVRVAFDDDLAWMGEIINEAEYMGERLMEEAMYYNAAQPSDAEVSK